MVVARGLFWRWSLWHIGLNGRCTTAGGISHHVLVCIGSTLFTLVSVNSFGGQMPPGFCANRQRHWLSGAGTILREGATIGALLRPACGQWLGRYGNAPVTIGVHTPQLMWLFFCSLEKRICREQKSILLWLCSRPAREVASNWERWGINQSVDISPSLQNTWVS